MGIVKYLLVLLVSLAFSNSFAVTKGQFMGLQMIINISSTSYDGSVDGSPQVLFEAMDRPEQDSFLGRGKSLSAPQKELNFICARRAENNYQCSIYIHKSARGRISSGKAYFEVQGEAAQAYFEQFHSQNGVFSYVDESNTFVIYATPQKFVIKFDAEGV